MTLNELSRQMTVIGFTGTNGKTSCTQFLAQALMQNQISCGIIGTLGMGFPGELKLGTHTTPDEAGLTEAFQYLSTKGAKAIAMEVSSHGLVQKRVTNVDFNMAVFTNLSRDHLDYHGNMENYKAAKKLLFEHPGLQHAVLNIDDAFGRELVHQLKGQVPLLTYGVKNADVMAQNISLKQDGFSATIITPWGQGLLHSKLLGDFNVSNILAVMSVLGLLGIPFNDALVSLEKLVTVPGRMETVKAEKKPLVVVDFAHTPDALEKVLLTLRKHCQGHLWCIFGCGGDRDRGKRKIMGEIAERYSDHLIITDDNPRTEDPKIITADILQGLLCPWAAEIEHDRKVAIAHALECAKVTDIILIAGKGHEPYQIIGTEKIPYNDVKEVKRLMR